MLKVFTAIGFAAAVFMAGLTTGASLATVKLKDTTEQLTSASFDKGYSSALTGKGLKDAILKNQDLSRKYCSAWWFDMTTKERKLK